MCLKSTLLEVHWNHILSSWNILNHFDTQLILITITWQYSECFHSYDKKEVKPTYVSQIMKQEIAIKY